MRKRILFATVLATGLVQSNVAAQPRIGNWNGSTRSRNNSAMATTSATMTSRSHTVFADPDIGADNLAGYDVFVIGEANRNTTVGETGGPFNLPGRQLRYHP